MKAEKHLFARSLVWLVVLVFLLGCTAARSSTHSIPSPDGSLTLITSMNQNKEDLTKYLCVKFQIVDATGKVWYEEQTGASDRMQWEMYWDENDRVVLESSDIGTLAWEQQADGTWRPIP